ncbi:MAG: Lrp/AsnC family transcriptional regulator [Thaumarchaeota archaeon]|nr:MAG: Lrp/AsnC family transcriptional regulator [Nitrososphaerota archaeon]TLX86449.1 MAG: Lrp/AsnC family transcriptional regulator [Nitrososphaerota archaeon]TLX91076.1 MAG: Lrp/AsnC family transcriptional regulator [Nitrososphaerota archaeon]
MYKIDDLDLKILEELSNDASISVPRLSRKININASVVYSRIKRLVKRGVIRKFTILMNDEALGFNVKALTGINMDSKLRDNVLSELFRIPGVTEISEVTGRFDILVTMNSHSLDEMHQFISERVGRIEGVQKTETFIEMRKTAREIPIPPSKKQE